MDGHLNHFVVSFKWTILIGIKVIWIFGRTDLQLEGDWSWSTGALPPDCSRCSRGEVQVTKGSNEKQRNPSPFASAEPVTFRTENVRTFLRSIWVASEFCWGMGSPDWKAGLHYIWDIELFNRTPFYPISTAITSEGQLFLMRRATFFQFDLVFAIYFTGGLLFISMQSHFQVWQWS